MNIFFVRIQGLSMLDFTLQKQLKTANFGVYFGAEFAKKVQFSTVIRYSFGTKCEPSPKYANPYYPESPKARSTSCCIVLVKSFA